MEKELDKLIESAKLTGRINLLMEMRDWLDARIKAAEKENENLRGQLDQGNEISTDS